MARSPQGGRVTEPPTTGSAGADGEPDAEQVARSIALSMLDRAPRSRAQLAEAMARRGVPDEVTTVVLDRFTHVGLVDDLAYAHTVVRVRHRERGQTGAVLRDELRRRGIDETVAASAMEQISGDEERATARRLVTGKLAATKGLDTAVRIRRTAAALGRRGYPSGLVFDLIREQLRAEEADNPVDEDDLHVPFDS